MGKQLEGLEKDNYCNLFLKMEDIVRVELETSTQKGGSGGEMVRSGLRP